MKNQGYNRDISSSERSIHPSGRFPSVGDEAAMRADFLFTKANPQFEKIVEELRRYNAPDQNNHIACNILAFVYGLHFYNTISNGALYCPGETPPYKIVADAGFPTVYVLGDSNLVYFNTASPSFEKELNIDPLEDFLLIGELEIEFPIYLTLIIDGLEEASHLHLQQLQYIHGSNPNSQTDHRYPKKLWKNSDSNMTAYRTKLWHEFAALVVQRACVQNYLSDDFPESCSEFENFYQEVRRLRQRWTRSRRHSI